MTQINYGNNGKLMEMITLIIFPANGDKVLCKSTHNILNNSAYMTILTSSESSVIPTTYHTQVCHKQVFTVR